ncbi:putative nuclease HARBI1 [Hydra vulgaris]|uniref:putative nuclease HARBI1 n=1 Tax=Hydra vulgaris TaxID=6087 RepID=UPI0032EA811C
MTTLAKLSIENEEAKKLNLGKIIEQFLENILEYTDINLPICQNHCEKGAFNTLIPELRFHDREFFYRFYRISPERYEHLLSMVAPSVTKKSCRSRQTISPSERLTVTLRYLATGGSQQTQSFYFRLDRTTVCNIINETTKTIWDVLQPSYLKAPESSDKWEKIANEFENEWNFSNWIGAMVGKHVCIEASVSSGSAYYNYKNYHSMVLLAICDAKYYFTLVDIGSYGRDNDASIFNESKIGKAFKYNLFKLTKNRQLSNGTHLPPVLVGDDIFVIKPWLMKPFSGKNLTIKERNFNYRLSRTRRTIKNSFGIMVPKWRIFRRPIKATSKNIENIIKAAICLHNYLKLNDSIHYVPSGFADLETNSGELIPGDWRKIALKSNVLNILPQCISNRYSTDASTVRLTLTEYFNHPSGSLSWQHNYVNSCGHNITGKQIFFQ